MIICSGRPIGLHILGAVRIASDSLQPVWSDGKEQIILKLLRKKAE